MALTENKYDVLVTEELFGSHSNFNILNLDVRHDIWKDEDEIVRQIQNFDALIVRNRTQVSKRIIDEGKRLKVIGRLGVGLDNIDIEHCRSKGVEVVYAGTSNTNAVVEYCMGQVFNLIRNLPRCHSEVKSGDWKRTENMGSELASHTLGVLGYGNAGKALAESMSKLGMKVCVYSRDMEKVPPKFAVSSIEDLFKLSTILSIHVSGGPETTNLVNQNLISLMARGSYIINTSRGSVINEDDLLDSLDNGVLGGVALDVRVKEPPGLDVLNGHPKVISSPHIAAFTVEAQRRVTIDVLEDVQCVLSGKTPKCGLNILGH